MRNGALAAGGTRLGHTGSQRDGAGRWRGGANGGVARWDAWWRALWRGWLIGLAACSLASSTFQCAAQEIGAGVQEAGLEEGIKVGAKW